HSAFPLALRSTHILETEDEDILTLLIKFIIGETDTSEPRPGWMRVLAMEIMRG
ncbi:hypothetical protein F5888DRAFT_1675137, partial [Russula emetica]